MKYLFVPITKKDKLDDQSMALNPMVVQSSYR